MAQISREDLIRQLKYRLDVELEGWSENGGYGNSAPKDAQAMFIHDIRSIQNDAKTQLGADYLSLILTAPKSVQIMDRINRVKEKEKARPSLVSRTQKEVRLRERKMLAMFVFNNLTEHPEYKGRFKEYQEKYYLEDLIIAKATRNRVDFNENGKWLSMFRVDVFGKRVSGPTYNNWVKEE